jgi:hypothetical protein
LAEERKSISQGVSLTEVEMRDSVLVGADFLLNEGQPKGSALNLLRKISILNSCHSPKALSYYLHL